MRITDVSIRIEPGEGETIKPATVVRKDKCWVAVNDDGSTRGLFPGEIDMIHTFMGSVLSKFHSKELV